jgi:hypothetical protein
VLHLLFSKISDLVCIFSLGGGRLGLGLFGFFLGNVVRRNSGTKRSVHFCFDDRAFHDGGEFDAVVVVLRNFVSMIELSSRRRI